jgi:ABC-type Fe3+/spermidine/putrescine transport system ATPase subunit
MVMSDRIALLRFGALEQIASPREIYSRPATSYTAQFIGHTNLLRGNVSAGMVHCNSLSWPVALPDGVSLFSLRPEKVRIADGKHTPGNVRLRGRVRHQAFHGATDLLQVECADGLMISMRTATRDHWQGEVEIEFSPDDAIAVKDSGEKS